MTDAVFTWVNGNDPAHATKRAAWLALEQNGELTRHSAAPTRFADSGELYFSVRLLRKYAPWIERVYVVTDEQAPDWLDASTRLRLGIHMIDHRDIFPPSEDLLPTFSARSIEGFLDRIDGLSEQFLYLNDDFFIVNPTREADYFSPKPVVRGAYLPDPVRATVGVVREVQTAGALLLPSSRFRDGYCGPSGSTAKWGQDVEETFWLAHAPYPLTRSGYAALAERFDIVANARFRFRGKAQHRPIALITNLELMNDNAETGPDDWSYIHAAKHWRAVVGARLDLCAHSGEIKSLCVQSLDMAPVRIQDRIITFLKERLEA